MSDSRPSMQSGDVDQSGQIVDEVLLARVARLRRIRAAIGCWLSDDVDAESQLSLVDDLLQRAQA